MRSLRGQSLRLAFAYNSQIYVPCWGSDHLESEDFFSSSTKSQKEQVVYLEAGWSSGIQIYVCRVEYCMSYLFEDAAS